LDSFVNAQNSLFGDEDLLFLELFFREVHLLALCLFANRLLLHPEAFGVGRVNTALASRSFSFRDLCLG